MQGKVILCSRMFDAQSGEVLTDRAILIEGNRIADIVAKDDIQLDNYEVIDLGDRFVMPGLIDCHLHLVGNGDGNSGAMRPFMAIGEMTMRAIKNARTDMLAGFTTLRSCGDQGFAAVAVKKAINAGQVWGPRVMAPGTSLGTTGSHSDSHYNPYIVDTVNGFNVGDGPDELVRATRYNIKHGADFIKFMATGGVMSLGTAVGAQQMAFDEMKAIVETAAMYGMHTATHAHGTSGIKTAIKAGVTSIEHGTMMDEECVQLMKEYGTYMVPTLIAPERIITNGEKVGTPQWAIDKSKQVSERHLWSFKRCVEEGVNIAFGTDAATPYNFHGKQTYEFELMVKAGMAPVQALQCATKHASELLRMQEDIGSLEKGKLADIVAFDGDPLTDITVMTQCAFVMKDGVVYKNGKEEVLA